VQQAPRRTRPFIDQCRREASRYPSVSAAAIPAIVQFTVDSYERTYSRLTTPNSRDPNPQVKRTVCINRYNDGLQLLAYDRTYCSLHRSDIFRANSDIKNWATRGLQAGTWVTKVIVRGELRIILPNKDILITAACFKIVSVGSNEWEVMQTNNENEVGNRAN
jgi:hypothetical protein